MKLCTKSQILAYVSGEDASSGGQQWVDAFKFKMADNYVSACSSESSQSSDSENPFVGSIHSVK